MLYYLIKLQQPVTTHWCLWVHNCFTSMRYSGFESFSGHIHFYLLHDVRPLLPSFTFTTIRPVFIVATNSSDHIPDQ